MRTKNKTPGLRIVGGTAYGPAGSRIDGTRPEPSIRRPEPPRNSDDPPLTETARNGQLREQRKKLWREAEAATRYWRVRMDFENAVSIAQSSSSRRAAFILTSV